MNMKQKKTRNKRASRYTFHKQRKHGCPCMDCLQQCHEVEQTLFREPPDLPCYRDWSCIFIIDCCNLLVNFCRGAEFQCCTFESYGHTLTLSSLNDLEMEFRYELNILHTSNDFFLLFFIILKTLLKERSNEARKTKILKYILKHTAHKSHQLKKDHHLETKHGMHKPLAPSIKDITFPLKAQQDIN